MEEKSKMFKGLSEKDIKAINGFVDFFNGTSKSKLEKIKIPCIYCEERQENEIRGKEFDLNPTAGFRNDRSYSSWIMKNKADKQVSILIATNNSNAVYFNINYCPICGRELI